MLILLAFMAASSSVADQRLRRMASLYEEVCLNSFPDDKAVEALMLKRQARELTASEVKVTMREDPSRAWELPDKSATIWIEFPPFHACSVRWSSPLVEDFQPYRMIADKYEAATGGYNLISPLLDDQGDIHIRITGEQRTLSDSKRESLLVVDQQISNETRRRAGETGMVLRFVHQIAQSSSHDSK